jgi:hypothetical protein
MHLSHGLILVKISALDEEQMKGRPRLVSFTA